MRASMLAASAAVMVFGLMIAGCQPPAAKQEAGSSCADDGPTFEGTSICVGRSVNFMDQDALAKLPTPREGCEWKPQLTKLSDDTALLFMGATCKGVATTFKFDGGKFGYASGDMYAAGQAPLIEVFDAPDADALAPLRAKIAALPAAQQKTCVIQVYGVDGAPVGAVVIGPTAQAAAKAPKDQPNAFCGEYGLNEDESSYWVVRGQKAMFVRMGQEQQDIADGTITVMTKDAEGNWAAAAPARGNLAECLLTVGGKTYIDGVCELNMSEDGGFQAFSKDYFAYAGKLDDGRFNLSWNESPANTHASALLGEDFIDHNQCLEGAKAKLCRWDLGKRKSR